MDSDFKADVKEFTETLLHPDNLHTKRINGETINCEKLLGYINVVDLTSIHDF